MDYAIRIETWPTPEDLRLRPRSTPLYRSLPLPASSLAAAIAAGREAMRGDVDRRLVVEILRDGEAFAHVSANMRVWECPARKWTPGTREIEA